MLTEPRLNFFLIRHGETEWNARKKLTSTSDIPLSSIGSKQAIELSEFLSEIEFDQIYSSPLSRAFNTAQLIIADNKRVINRDERLIEVNFGKFEGENALELEEQSRSDTFNEWRKGKPIDTEFGMEPLKAANERGMSFINELEGAEGNVLVVSHGYFLRLIISTWALKQSVSNFNSLWLSNGSCSVVSSNELPQLRALNLTAGGRLRI